MACLLGGYGIPAEVGLAAYERLRAVNAESPCRLLDEESVLELLADPLDLNGRLVRYRFAKQKSTYLAGSMRALQSLDREAPDRELRDALTALPGVGPKTASWIVRNWRDSDFVSILDIHILRAGRMLQIFPEGKSVERHYLELEAAFLDFAEAISVKASILDSVMDEHASDPCRNPAKTGRPFGRSFLAEGRASSTKPGAVIPECVD